jgi:hypothetical protein
MKSAILESYCSIGRITREFPLSARAIIALFSLSFVFMLLINLAFWCVACVGGAVVLLKSVYAFCG